MTIFVTGGAGYIGTHTVLELIKQGYDVVVADNFSNSKSEAVNRVRELAGTDFSFYEMDIRDSKKLDEVFNAHDISCVIHFAGAKAVGESVSKPIEYYSNNIDSTLELCKAMKRHDVKKIIFSSSATVYSGYNEMPLTEDSEIGKCTNPYGWTKFMCEQILRDIAHADRDWSVVLLRYFNPIGAHESGKIGEDPHDVPNNLMPFVAQVAVGRLPYLKIYGSDYDTPDGTGVRDYIHVVDLAKGHVAAIKYLQNNLGAHVFNLGTGRGASVLELVSAFEMASDVKIPYEIVGRRAGDLPTTYAATDKAENKLKWKAEKTLLDACKDSWRWQKNNPEGYEVNC